MTISELSHDQKIALVALMKAIALANANVSDDEATTIETVANAIGDDLYRNLLDEAETRFADMDELKTFLSTIVDPAARELIYGTIWDESMAEADTQHTETALLEWLASTWDIQAKS